TAVNGFNGAVALSVAGVPAGASASFNPASVTGAGSSTLTVGAGTAAAGSYTLTVTGTSGSLSHAASIALTIAAAPDFSIAASPAALTLVAGGSGASAPMFTAANGFNGDVALAVAGVPAGATASFNPASLPGGGTSTLTVGAGTAAPGKYTLAV